MLAKTHKPTADCRLSAAINYRVLCLTGVWKAFSAGAWSNGWLVGRCVSTCSNALDTRCNSALDVKFISSSSSSYHRATSRMCRAPTKNGRTDGWTWGVQTAAGLLRLSDHARECIARREAVVLAGCATRDDLVAKKSDEATLDVNRITAGRYIASSLRSPGSDRRRWKQTSVWRVTG